MISKKTLIVIGAFYAMLGVFAYVGNVVFKPPTTLYVNLSLSVSAFIGTVGLIKSRKFRKALKSLLLSMKCVDLQIEEPEPEECEEHC